MPITTMDRILTHARSNEYAVGAFLCANLETAQAAIAAAEAKRSPVVIRIHPDLRAITKFSTLTAAAKQMAGEARVPVAISLDHGATIGDTIDAVRAGATSVMLDAAEEPLEENIRRVKAVVEAVGPLGILVEAAVGNMEHGAVQKEEDYADIEQAKRLIRETGASILAPAVGNVHGSAHGATKAEPNLNIERIRALHRETGVPICLHGGSGIPRDMMQNAAVAGVALVIIFTDVIGAFDDELRRVLNSRPGSIDIMEALIPAQRAAQEVIERKMDDFGSTGRSAAFLDWDREQVAK